MRTPRASAALASRRRKGEIAGVRCTAVAHGLHGGRRRRDLLRLGRRASAFGRPSLSAGASVGIKPVGLGARDTLRLEPRLSLYGNDIDDTTNPLEAGLGWVVKIDKGDFVGRAALAKRQRHEPLARQARRLLRDGRDGAWPVTVIRF